MTGPLWGPVFVGRICRRPLQRRRLFFQAMNVEALEKIENWRRHPQTVGVFTDIDGTLAPIVPTPDLSEVPKELLLLLKRLAGSYRVVAGISGRATPDAKKLLGLEDVVYYGNHGFEILRDGTVEVVPEAMPYADKVRELEKLSRDELEPRGAFVEGKGITASIHYRNIPPEVGELCKAFVKREGERLGLRITVGRGVVEARPPIHADKGSAIRRLVEDYGPEKALFMGDDTTDLDAFRALEELREEGVLLETLRIGVRSDERPPEIVSEADLVVDGVESVGEVLRVLAGDGSGR